ncbi:PREDICTED: uncharacterized protein LOC105359497 [Ceratosolen solmsi marchali]|uniref:Uncharacterized protein LOC105359497 n=1 Tax=Ceratosolen solmsi marchali TaxID=326594 RepID=A0AAJ6YBS1_9HYME|nr:PREDICTED: uncharacterized protein LOC105359497 [Ceratosolen solmsi marchali]
MPESRAGMARRLLRLGSLFLFALAPLLVHSQLTWTPIYVGNKSQIDLWTQSMTGCPCNFNSSKTACACCVPSGGCSCGATMPNRCTQCGLENYCANMCNVTLDSRQLFSKSDRGFGQIKSPQFKGPSICTYRFVPDTGQRVELQVWRMISIGQHNGTACEGGWLQFEGGARICGRNSRLQQPIVLFSDKPEPVLHMQINEETERSTVYAFYSFASTASTSVGWPAKGGRRVTNTDCDWVYEENQCHRGCVLASPGYPGLYPPNSRCRFLITANSTVSINISFTAVLMPVKHCTSDYIAVYAGPTTSSAVLKTLCGNQTGSVVHIGKDLLVEFRSGPEVDPFNYNGFVATLNFVELTTEVPTTTTVESTSKDAEVFRSSTTSALSEPPTVVQQQQHSGCDVEVNGERLRTGSHTTRGRTASSSDSCRLTLLGRDYDTVHVSVPGYALSMASCKSQIEVFDGLLDEKSSTNVKPIGKICGPTPEQHQKQISSHEAPEKKRYSSSSRNMTIVLTRASDNDFMDVSFYFYNERESGTQQPKTFCDVEYYGLSSPTIGTVVHPKAYKFNSISGNIKCKQHFIPAANQAIIITLNSTMNQTYSSHCTTQCGDQGCRCASNESLDNIDHLLLVSRPHGNTLACLCGNSQDWLPVEFWSTTPVYIEWSRSSHAGLNLTAEYKFAKDSFCGSHNVEKLEGEIHAGYSANFSFALNHYYQQKCTYIIDSPANRELAILIESSQTRPCTAWNLTVHEYNKTNGNSEGPRLHTFCPRDIARNFTVSQDIRSVIVKLQALGRTAPQYVLKWRSSANSTKSRNKSSAVSNSKVAMAGASTPGVAGTALTGLLILILLPLHDAGTHLNAPQT